ncbi:hypothetical protein TYRP_012048 [Tyrophagus putrescentiae]|nr:hypothetical protein TYRP_012048 [Tyrophagus putrescentiae]
MLTAAEQKLNLVFRVTATAFGFLNTVGCIAFLILSLRIFKSSDSQRVEYAIAVHIFSLSVVSLAGQIFGFIGIILQNFILSNIHSYVACGLFGVAIVRAFWYPVLWAFVIWFFVHGLAVTIYSSHLKELRKKYGNSAPAPTAAAAISSNPDARNKI